MNYDNFLAKDTNTYLYGIFRKNSNKCVMRCRTKEEAEKFVKYDFIECEVRPLWKRSGKKLENVKELIGKAKYFLEQVAEVETEEVDE